MSSKQSFQPLPKETLHSIKSGDIIERMLGFCIPSYIKVKDIKDDVIDAYWTFDRNTGLEIDDDISVPVSYIRRVLTEDQIKQLEEGVKEIAYP